MTGADRTVVHVTSAGTTTVECDALAAAAARLRAFAERLDGAAADLMTATYEVATLPGTPEAAALDQALRDVRTAWYAPHHLADDVRALARGMAGAAERYAEAESDAARAARAGLEVAGAAAAGSGPLMLPLLVSTGVAWVADQVLRDWVRNVLLWVRGGRNPLDATIDGLPSVPARLLDAPGTADALAFVTGALATTLPPWMRSGRAMEDLVAAAARAVPFRPPSVTPLLGPVVSPRVRDLGDAMRLVGSTYGHGPVGLPEATITVQRIERADGAVSWVVAIPGTQSPGLTGLSPTHNGTNAQLAAGRPDAMSAAVLAAMAAAGVGREDPVMLVGHSQGGMVAATVAATGAYAVRAVVTAGSPDVPRTLPPGTVHVALVNDMDGVPSLDAEPGTRRADVVGIDSRSLPDQPFEAHDVGGYARTADAVDAALAEAPEDSRERQALADVLGVGPGGATTTTTQWVATTPPQAVLVPAPAPSPQAVPVPPEPSARAVSRGS
ncbi:hypothetical protein [Cellulomonas shaoxiangyii]|uniref:Alpha/beta hydrolase n=1 Tax=Cellulomonas shaoxiangyii TaxID=2566013 RepID=A0A4P7SPJ3_9CELL|nr:hypothetical protein [Cellulomonas shaoxiangyii]QCB94914.1 hypothetical protein E5225_16430 [Cellulomonas shaoxiangyii]TGY77255.1 hypothetical protein E5226_17205 [Cellulomonas shaoxiangyii]